MAMLIGLLNLANNERKHTNIRFLITRTQCRKWSGDAQCNLQVYFFLPRARHCTRSEKTPVRFVLVTVILLALGPVARDLLASGGSLPTTLRDQHSALHSSVQGKELGDETQFGNVSSTYFFGDLAFSGLQQ